MSGRHPPFKRALNISLSFRTASAASMPTSVARVLFPRWRVRQAML